MASKNPYKPTSLKHWVSLCRDKMDSHKQRCFSIRNCRLCLGMNEPNKTESVCPFGSLMSPVMFVFSRVLSSDMHTQVPCLDTKEGYPLHKVFAHLGKHFWDYYLTYSYKCHLLTNRVITKQERYNCEGYLKNEIYTLKPKLIIALGDQARDTLLGLGFGFKFSRTQWEVTKGKPDTVYIPSLTLAVKNMDVPQKKKWMVNLIKLLRRDKYQHEY